MTSKTQVEIGAVRNAKAVESPLELLPEGVHLWQRELPALPEEVNAHFALLTRDEKERAMRFRVDWAREAFVLTRATLRILLGCYLEDEPNEIRFRYESHGKPYLESESNVQFNVSHTDGLALIGVTRGRRIGVDVEKIKPDTEVEKLAERFFSEQERQELRRLGDNELRTAFFRVWSRKEAYIKATGEGLSLPLHQFDVSIQAHDHDALRATRPEAAEAERWMVSDVAVGSEYAAAVAIEIS